MLVRVAKQLLRGARDRRHIDPGVRILTYHGVIERRLDPLVEASFHLLADFRSHVQYLRHCRVVSLDDLGEAMQSRHLRPCVAITFDDGFRNNIVAAEILHQAKLPATVFVATENIERGETIWPTLLRLVLAHGSMRAPILGGTTYNLDGDVRAFASLRDGFKNASTSERKLLWAELLSHLYPGELEDLVVRFPSIAMMSWDEVRSLRSAGVAIGSHGTLHELHHERQPAEVRIHELASSKATIENTTGCQCNHFAFPNGTFTATSPSELRAAGYTMGFTMISRAAGRREDPMLLPRLVPGAGVEKLISSLVFGN